MTYPFVNDINCDGTEIEYYGNANEDEEAEEENDEEEQKEVSEFCQAVFQEEALPLENCGQEDEEENENEDEEQDGDDNYNWYTYDLSAEDKDDAAAVCTFLSEYEGEYTAIYDTESSGSLFDYTPASAGSGKSSGANFGKAIGIIFIIAVVLLAIAFGVKSLNKSDEKKAPLVLSDGVMAWWESNDWQHGCVVYMLLDK